MANETSGSIQSRKDFKQTPSGQYKYWLIELQSAFKRLKQWQIQGDVIQKRFIDDKVGQGIGASLHGSYAAQLDGHTGKFRLNLFHSNTKTITSMLYGKLPRIDVSRTDTTGNDDIARVAAEMIERILRLDLATQGEKHDLIFKSVLQDRMLPGLGCARVRYEVETVGDGDDEKVEREDAPLDYYFWNDVAWGWGRGFSDLPWIAFRSYMSRDKAAVRFGEKLADQLKLKQRTVVGIDDGVMDPDQSSAWQEAEIWEIWDKERKKVVWISIGCDKVLDTKSDTLKLNDFYPCPPFFLANPTTRLYIPTPDYHMAQDLYTEIDVLQTRISIITEAVKVTGVYDSSAEGIKRMLQEGNENDLIPVDNWAMFAEKGGIQGQVDWMPILDIVSALDKLRSLRDESIGLLQQVSGMSDIMRGELQNQYEGVGQTQIKAKFASSRIQAISEEFARFVTDLMELKAEVICKHFSPQTIAEQSNMQFSPDKESIPKAIELLKDTAKNVYRIEVKSETMAQEDFARLQQERSAYLNGLSTFIQAAGPMIQQDPRSTPFLLQMLKWAMAGFKGASDIEGVLDQAIDAMSQPQQQEKPESDADKQGQIQIQLEQIRSAAKKELEQIKTQQEMQIRDQDMQMDIQTRQEEHRMAMELSQSNAYNEAQIIAAKMEADVQTELLTSQINAEQQAAGQEGEIRKAVALAKLDIIKLVEGKKMDAGMKFMEKKMDAEEHDKDRVVQLRTAKSDD